MKIFWSIFAVLVLLGIASWFFGSFNEAGEVAQDEFGPKAVLEKYEWFIDQATGIEKMDQDIKIFEKRVQGIDKQYTGYGEDKSKWPAHIQVQYDTAYQQARDDLMAVISQRNNLVKEYNAQSQKFNWKPFQTKPDKPEEIFYE